MRGPIATEPKVRLSETFLLTLLKSLSSAESLRLMWAAVPLQEDGMRPGFSAYKLIYLSLTGRPWPSKS